MIKIKESGAWDSIGTPDQGTATQAGPGVILEGSTWTNYPIRVMNGGPQLVEQDGYILYAQFTMPAVYGNNSRIQLVQISPKGEVVSFLFEESNGEFNGAQGDDHRLPSINYTKDGRIVVFVEKGKNGDSTFQGDGNHNTPIVIWASKKPYDVQGIQYVTEIPGEYQHSYLYNYRVNKKFMVYARGLRIFSGGTQRTWGLDLIEIDDQWTSFKIRPMMYGIKTERVYPWRNIIANDQKPVYSYTFREESLNKFFLPGVIFGNNVLGQESEIGTIDGSTMVDTKRGALSSTLLKGRFCPTPEASREVSNTYSVAAPLIRHGIWLQDGSFLAIYDFFAEDANTRFTVDNKLIRFFPNGDVVRYNFRTRVFPDAANRRVAMEPGIAFVWQMPSGWIHAWELTYIEGNQRYIQWRSKDLVEWKFVKNHLIEGLSPETFGKIMIAPCTDGQCLMMAEAEPLGDSFAIGPPKPVYIEKVYDLGYSNYSIQTEISGTLFNGINQYVKYDTGSGISGFFGKTTITATAQLDQVPGTVVLWAHGIGAYRVYIGTGTIFINSFNTEIPFPIGNPVNIAVDFDNNGDGLELRLEGVTVWTGTAPANVPGNTFFTVGARENLGVPGLFFPGRIWNVEILGYLKWNGLSGQSSQWEDSGFTYSVSSPSETLLSDTPQGSPVGRGFPAIGLELTSDGYLTCVNYGLDISPPFTGQIPSIVKVSPTDFSVVDSETDISLLVTASTPGVQGITQAFDGSYFIVEGTNGIIRRLNPTLTAEISSFNLADSNGIAHDNSSKTLWILSVSGVLRQVDYSGNILGTYGLYQTGLNNFDHLTLDKVNSILWLSQGDVSFAKIVPFNVKTKGFGTPINLQNPFTSYIEGIAFSADKTRLYVSSDAGLKDIAENNTIQEYIFTSTPGARNGTLINF